MCRNKNTFILILVLAFIVLIISLPYYYKFTTTDIPIHALREGVAPSSQLVKGEMLFNPPEEMKVGIKERIKVNITEKFAESLIKEKLIEYEKDKIKEIDIGTIMEVRLKGNNFIIENLNNPIQLILKGEETKWNWDVIPLRSGHQLLSLTVSIVITLPNDIKGKKDYPVFDNLVKVRPNLIYSAQMFMGNYWQHFIAIFAGFFINEFLRKIKKRKKRKIHYVRKSRTD